MLVITGRKSEIKMRYDESVKKKEKEKHVQKNLKKKFNLHYVYKASNPFNFLVGIQSIQMLLPFAIGIHSIQMLLPFAIHDHI